MADTLGTEGVVELWKRNHGTAEVEYARALRGTLMKLGHDLMFDLTPLLSMYGPQASMIEATFPVEAWHAAITSVSAKMLGDVVTVGVSTELYLAQRRTREQIRHELRRGIPVWLRTKMSIPTQVLSRIVQWTQSLVAQPYWLDVVGTVRGQIIDAVATGAEQGLSGQEVAGKIQGLVGMNGSAQRAMVIARTESTGALNAGHEIARQKLNSMGLIKGKQWACIRDTDARPDHLKADGQVVGPNEQFVVGGEPCSHPGDVSLSAKQRVNCRCTVISVLKSAEEIDTERSKEPVDLPPQPQYENPGTQEQIVVGSTMASHLYTPFDSEAQVEKWAREGGNEVTADDTIAAIKSWAVRSRKIQAELRKEGVNVFLSDWVRDIVMKLDIGMGRHHTRSPAVGYRAASLSAFVDDPAKLKLLVGHSFRDDGYGPILMLKKQVLAMLPMADTDEEDAIVVAVRVPPGTSCLYTTWQSEQGVHAGLLPRGGTYRIIEVSVEGTRVKLVVELTALASQQAGKSRKRPQHKMERIEPYDRFVWFPGELTLMTPWSPDYVGTETSGG